MEKAQKIHSQWSVEGNKGMRRVGKSLVDNGRQSSVESWPVNSTAWLPYRELRSSSGSPPFRITNQLYVQCAFRGHSVQDAIFIQEHTSQKVGQNTP